MIEIRNSSEETIFSGELEELILAYRELRESLENYKQDCNYQDARYQKLLSQYVELNEKYINEKYEPAGYKVRW